MKHAYRSTYEGQTSKMMKTIALIEALKKKRYKMVPERKTSKFLDVVVLQPDGGTRSLSGSRCEETINEGNLKGMQDV